MNKQKTSWLVTLLAVVVGCLLLCYTGIWHGITTLGPDKKLRQAKEYQCCNCGDTLCLSVPEGMDITIASCPKCPETAHQVCSNCGSEFDVISKEGIAIKDVPPIITQCPNCPMTEGQLEKIYRQPGLKKGNHERQDE